MKIKIMKKIIGLFCFCVLFAVSVSAQTNVCFENKGLKSTHRISFELQGSKIVEGYYETIGDQPDTSAETFEFSGTKSGNNLTIKFVGTIPYERPPRTKAIVWTLGKNVLIVPTYGKNYNTNKRSTYQAKYEKCAE